MTYICHMKVEVDITTLETAVKYLTIMYLINNDTRNEEFTKTIEELEKIIDNG